LPRLLISEVFPPKTGGSGRWFWELYRRLPRDSYVIAAGEDPRRLRLRRRVRVRGNPRLLLKLPKVFA
jgi:hypothetical protein